MRKLITIFLILALALSMTAALVACTPEMIEVPDDQNPEKIPTVNDGVSMPDAMTALKEIIASFDNDGGNASFNIALPVRLEGTAYSVKILGNLPTSGEDSLELLMQVSDAERVLFGFYIVNGKIFVEVFDGNQNNSVKINITDIDADYLTSLLSKLDPSLITGALDGLLGGLGLTLDSIINLVVPMLFTTTVYRTAPAATEIVVTLDLSQVLGLLGSIIPTLDDLVKDIMVTDGLGDFVAGIVNAIPTFHVDIHSVIESGKSKVFDVSLITDKEVFGLSADVKFGSEKIDIGLPSDLAAYKPFSILNLAFNISLGLHTDGLDMGKLINKFAPNTLPENLLVFTSDRELTLKVNISLDPNNNNNNLILLELYNGTDTTIDANRMLGAYFIDGTLKVNVTDVSHTVNIPNIEIKGLNISALISNAVKLLKSTIDGALEGLFPSDGGDSELNNTSMIVPASVGYDGEAVISADVTAFVQALTKVFRMSDFVKLEENALTIDVNADFFTSLETLVPSLKGTLDTFKDIGAISLAVNLAPWGIDNVDLTYRPNNDDNIFNVNINSFLVGFKTPDLEKSIRQRVANKEYSSNIEGILKGALDGVELEGELALALKKGNYNLASMLSGFVTLPAIDVAIPEDVTLDIGLKLQLSFDTDAPDDPNKTQGLLEITLNKDISIFKKGKLLGLYIMGNDLYLEVNGIGDINIPKLKVKTDFMTLLNNEIQKLKYDLNFEGMLEGLIPAPASASEANLAAAAAESSVSAVQGDTAMDSILNIIDLNINETTLKVAVTSMALQKLLAKLGTDIALPPFDLTASLTDLDDIEINVNALGFASLTAKITHANIGREISVDLPAINPDDYSGDLQSVITNLLKGVDLQAEFNLHIAKGLNLGTLLQQLQIPLPFDLDLTFTEAVTLGLKLNLQMAYDANDPSQNKFLLEIDLPSDILFLKAGRLLSIYGTRDSLFVEIGELNGIKIPKVKLNIDIMTMLGDILKTIDMDFIINAGGGTNPTPAPVSGLAAAADFDSTTIFVKQNYIQLYVTSELILELLKTLGVIQDFSMPEFDINIEIGDGSENVGFTGIFINAAMGSELTADLSVTELTAGQPININLPQLNNGYLDSLSEIAKALMEGAELEAELGIVLHAGEHNLAAIFQLFEGVALPDVIINVTERIEIRATLNIKLAYDQNNPKNSKLSVELYVLDDILNVIRGSAEVPFISIYGINKSLYGEMRNTIGFTVPKVSAQIDVFDLLLKELDKIDIQSLIYGSINGGGSGGGATPAAVAASDAIQIEINNESLKLYATMTAILNLIKALSPGMSIDIPNFDLSLEFNGLDDIRINADKVLNALSLSLKFGVKTIGMPVNVEIPNINPDEYNGSLTNVVKDLLDGISAEANLKLTMNKGIYDISSLLKDLISLPPIVLDVQEETVLDLTLKLQLKHDSANPINSKLLFELYLNNDVAFAKAGKLLSVYGQNGSLYCELTTIQNVSIPRLKIDLDIFSVLQKALDNLNINFILKENNAGVQAGAGIAPVGYAQIADLDNSIIANINKESLKIVIAANAFAELLKMIVPNVTLPAIDLSAEISGFDGIKISLGVGSYLTAALSFNNLIIGDAGFAMQMPEINDSDYVNDLKTLVRDVLTGIDMEAVIQARFLPGEHDISGILALFNITAPPILFTIPGTEAVTVDLRLVLKTKQFNVANGDKTERDGAALIELWVENDFLLFNGGKKLLGIYSENKKTYLEISPDGAINGINGVKVALGLDLIGELDKVVENITESFVIDSSGWIKTDNKENQGGGGSQGAPSETAALAPAGKAGGGSIGVTLNQDSVRIAVTAMALQQLLGLFGLNIALPDFDATVAIDAINGVTIGANLMGIIGLDIALTKTTVGDPNVTVVLPEFNEKDYAGDLNKLVDNLLTGAEINAGLKLTLTKDFNINELIDSFGIPFAMPPISIAIPDAGVTLDARLHIQLKFNPDKPNESKALVELWLNEAPILFDNEGIKHKPFIGLYYENESIYAEINNVKGVNIPKIMLKYDFMSELHKIIANMPIDFDNITFSTNETPAPTAELVNPIAGNESINIGIKQDTLSLAVTLNAIKQLLSSFNVNLPIPDIDLSLDATIMTLQNIALGIGAGVNGKTMLKLDLSVSALSFGDPSLNIDLTDKIVRDKDGNPNPAAYNTDLQSLLNEALEGVQISADFKLQINKGFDLANFLDGLGITLPNLDVAFPTDVVLDATMNVQLKYDAANVENTVGKIEIYVNQSVLFINKGLLLAVYINGNDLYLQVGERAAAPNPDGTTSAPQDMGGIAGVTIPIIKIKTDIVTLIHDKLATLNIGFIFDKKEEPSDPTAPSVTASNETRGESDVNVTINKDALLLRATSLAIQQLLDEFNVDLGLILPDFDIYGELNGLDDISINVNHNELVILDLAFRDLKFGDPSIELTGMPDFNEVSFSDNLAAIVEEVLKGIDVEAGLSLTLKGGEYNLAAIINSFGLSIPDIFVNVDDDDDPANGYGDLILDVTAKLQLNLDVNNTLNSRGKLELWLNKDIAIAKASADKPLLGVYIIGGDIYLEINNLEKVTVPKIKLKGDVTTLIAGLIANLKSEINVNIGQLIGGTPATGGSGAATVADNAITDDSISVAVNQDAIKLTATAEALSAFLSGLGLAFSWPDIDVTAEIKNVNGVTLAVNLGATAFDLAEINLSLNKVVIGKLAEIDLSRVNVSDYDNSLKTIVENLLTGIDVGGKVNLTVPKGTYDFSAFLAQFNVSIPPIAYTLTQDLPLESRFVLKTAFDKSNPDNSRAIIEWIITNPGDVFFIDQQKLRIGANGQPEAVMLGLYVDGGATYLDLSNIIISNLRLPRVKLNSNILSKLTGLIDLLQFDLDLDKLFGINGGNGGGIAPTAEAAVGGEPVIGISSNALHLKVTAAAIKLLLSTFGVNIELPDFDVTADITELTGINLSFSMGFSDNTISLDMKEIKASFGEVPEIIVPEGMDTDTGFGESVKDIVLNLISDVDISGKLDIQSAKSVLNITSIVNAIMATTGQYFDIPININMDDFSNTLYFDVKWHLEKDNPRASEASIAIFSTEGDLTISIYLQSGNLYVDLSGLGLMQFKISNFNFTGLIGGILEKIEPMLTKDLSVLLDGVLSGLKPVADVTAAETPEDMARRAMSYNKMQALMNEAAQGDEVIDLITVILSALDISDTLIKLDFQKAFIDDLISRAGVYLGLDLYGGISFDIMKGTLNGSATVNEINFGFDFNVNTVGDIGSMKDKIYFYDFLAAPDANGIYPKKTDVPYTENYTEYSLLSVLDILQSVLGGTSNTTASGNKVPLAYVDLYNSAPEALALGSYYDDPNRYGGYGNGATTRAYIQRVTSYDSFAGGKGSLHIGLWKDFEMSVNPINLALDIPAGRLKVLGTTDLFNTIVNGSLLNLNLEVNLAGILAPIIDPILKDLPEDLYIKDALDGANGAIAPTADITASGDDGTAAVNITDYLKSINLSMFETGTTKIDVDLNGKTISDMLVNLLHDLFWNLDLNGTGNPARIDYKGTAERGSGFYDQLWNNLIKPLIAQEAGSAAAGVSGIVKGDIGNTISRLLPLPMFTEMKVSVTFADSKFKAINIATENSARTSEQLRLNIYPAGQEDVVDWGYIPGSVVFDPYSTDKLTTQFENKWASRNNSDGGAHWTKLDTRGQNTSHASRITYGGDYDRLKAMDNSGNYTPGEYTIVATAKFHSTYQIEPNLTYTRNIKIRILEKGTIESVEDVYVHGYGEIPNQVTVNMRMADGTLTKRVIKGVRINSEREGYGEREHMTTVNLGGVNRDVRVVYLDSTISQYDGEFNVDAYSMQTLVQKLPSRVFFKYGSGYFSSQEVVWDTSALNGLTQAQWIEGGEYTVTASIPDGTANPQKMTYKVHLRTTNISSVQFEGENSVDMLTVDPYRAIQEREAAVLAADSGVFPQNATIIYTDGRKEVMPITWSGMENYSYTTEGGLTKATITNAIGDYRWSREVDVRIIARTIKYVSFGKDASGNDVKELNINPYEYMNNKSILPTTVLAVFEEGEPVEVPCAWSIPDGTVTAEGGYKQVTLTIMPDSADMRTSFKPILNVKRMNIVDIDLPKDDDNVPQYTMNEAVTILYGDQTIDQAKPKKLTFILDTGEKTEIYVQADFSGISVTSQGGTFKATKFTLPDGTVYSIDVVIPVLIASGTPDSVIEVDAAEFAKQGDGIFPNKWRVEFNGIVHTVNVKWVLDNVTMNGGTALMIVGDGSRVDLRIPIKVSVIGEAVSAAA